jgi:hypothetical protein
MVSNLPGDAAFHPLVDFFFPEFPQATDLVGRHVLFAYPLVGSIALDAKIFRYFIDREPPVVHVLIPLLWWLPKSGFDHGLFG